MAGLEKLNYERHATAGNVLIERDPDARTCIRLFHDRNLGQRLALVFAIVGTILLLAAVIVAHRPLKPINLARLMPVFVLTVLLYAVAVLNWFTRKWRTAQARLTINATPAGIEYWAGNRLPRVLGRDQIKHIDVRTVGRRGSASLVLRLNDKTTIMMAAGSVSEMDEIANALKEVQRAGEKATVRH
jgi:hypothetical protein